MRKAVLVAAITLVAAISPAVRAMAGDSLPTSRFGCQPDPTLQAQLLHCTYGPLVVTPGTNMILLGPVTIESPRAEGYITSFAPNLVLAATGEVPPIHEVHLHHGVWINAAKTGTTPFFATGEEKTRSQIPDGYGYRTSATDAWVLNYMLHNLTASAYTVMITYDLTWVPASAGLKDVVPVWLDAVANNDSTKQLYPVYDPAQDGTGYTSSFGVDRDAEIVWVGGHVHPGGLRDELFSETCGQPLFTSNAVPNDPANPRTLGSWDYRMTVTNPDWRFTVHRGDRVSVTGYYDNSHPWYEAMAIMFAWAHPLTPAEMQARTPCTPPTSTTGSVTDPPNPPNQSPVFGGANEGRFGAQQSQVGSATTSVAIRGFDYSPGGIGQPPPAVHPGDHIVFTNYDAAGSIFHSVTSCVNPCDGDYGQSYPLATWPSATQVGDSGQLGYGPPQATASVQRSAWTYIVPAGAPNNTVLTYFCRIHPFMRGSLKVVQ
ncbi:MAG: hypothetical protein QOI95_862 [Acidimicrobiaceae bacterium]|jgi:hypothetical protein